MLNRTKYHCFMFSVVFCLFHSELSISGENPAVATEENFDIKEEQHKHNRLVNAMHEDPRGTNLEKLLNTGNLPVDARGKSGQTPLMVAESFKYTECINILKKHNADENAIDFDGNSMEHYRQMNKAGLQGMYRFSGCTSEPPCIHIYDDSGWNCLCCSDSPSCVDCGACSECLGNCGECMTGCGENLAGGAKCVVEALANVMESVGDFVGDLADAMGDLADAVGDD